MIKMKARLNEGNIQEVIIGGIDRLPEAKVGFGWYQVEQKSYDLQLGEYLGNKSFEYDVEGDKVYQVREVLTHTVDYMRTLKLTQIKNTYTELTNEGFMTSKDIKLDCRESDKTNWLTLKLDCLANPDKLHTIKDFDNGVHSDLSSADVLVMLTELEGHYTKLLTDKWTYETLINSYTEFTEVEAFYWRKAIYDEETLELIDYTYWGN